MFENNFLEKLNLNLNDGMIGEMNWDLLFRWI
jgi:hypothetical protein